MSMQHLHILMRNHPTRIGASALCKPLHSVKLEPAAKRRQHSCLEPKMATGRPIKRESICYVHICFQETASKTCLPPEPLNSLQDLDMFQKQKLSKKTKPILQQMPHFHRHERLPGGKPCPFFCHQACLFRTVHPMRATPRLCGAHGGVLIIKNARKHHLTPQLCSGREI